VNSHKNKIKIKGARQSIVARRIEWGRCKMKKSQSTITAAPAPLSSPKVPARWSDQHGRRLEIEVSLLGTVYRRTHFLVQYMLARIQLQTIRKLLPIVERTFEHPWVVAVELKVRPGHGREKARFWNRNRPVSNMQWDAPITISVFRSKQGKKWHALCMSLYVIKDNIYIKQLQGVSPTDAPSALREWPKMFIQACQDFTRQQAFKTVRVAKADYLYSYHNPYTNVYLSPHCRERAIKQIRQNMELLYDASAAQLGFVSDGNWFKWTNSEVVPGTPAR
jgi:hypothetical protein